MSKSSSRTGGHKEGAASHEAAASVLLPRMPAGLDLLSGAGSYEAVARVARAMGRAASSQPGLHKCSLALLVDAFVQPYHDIWKYPQSISNVHTRALPDFMVNFPGCPLDAQVVEHTYLLARTFCHRMIAICKQRPICSLFTAAALEELQSASFDKLHLDHALYSGSCAPLSIKVSFMR